MSHTLEAVDEFISIIKGVGSGDSIVFCMTGGGDVLRKNRAEQKREPSVRRLIALSVHHPSSPKTVVLTFALRAEKVGNKV